MEGNYYARRKFVLLKGLLEHIGIEPGRLHFSWISSAESTKFVEVAKAVAKEVEQLGPGRRLVKRRAEVI
ncbi:MAG: hydrogenase iron-sulfur subunit [Deltaproteobacteria bacterium]|nr:hydrogenase iron-sulfur subunit [Deltaproteobacteria bacterium]